MAFQGVYATVDDSTAVAEETSSAEQVQAPFFNGDEEVLNFL